MPAIFPRTAFNIMLVTLASLTVVACNNRDNDGVRNGPQAVHPSASALSQQTAVPVVSY